MKNLKSPVAWHVMGILHKDGQNFAEAKKCYLNAVKHDGSNSTILRDLSNLQVFLKDYSGNQETRRIMLQAKMD